MEFYAKTFLFNVIFYQILMSFKIFENILRSSFKRKLLCGGVILIDLKVSQRQNSKILTQSY